LPFLQYFLSVLNCADDNQGNLVHYAFTEVECWSGMYIIHAIFSIIGSILFIGIGLVGSLTFFEYKSNPNDPTTRYFLLIKPKINFYLESHQDQISG